MKRRYWLPVVIFLALIALFAIGLSKDPTQLDSPLLNQTHPPLKSHVLTLHGDAQEQQKKSPENMVWILNVFASWCVSCVEEHRLLTAFKVQHPQLTLIGLNYQDHPADARQWLAQHGNPYDWVYSDLLGQDAINWGIHGVPETFVMDRQGKIRLILQGPVTSDRLTQQLEPVLEQLQDEY